MQDKDAHHSEQETIARREAALKRMLSTPHKPHKPLGKKARRDGGAAKKKRREEA
jgi:hypothetical protein